jgi:hypothetical protein
MWFILGVFKYFFIVLGTFIGFLYLGLPLIVWLAEHGPFVLLMLCALIVFIAYLICGAYREQFPNGIVAFYREVQAEARAQKDRLDEYERQKLAEALKARSTPEHQG